MNTRIVSRKVSPRGRYMQLKTVSGQKIYIPLVSRKRIGRRKQFDRAQDAVEYRRAVLARYQRLQDAQPV